MAGAGARERFSRGGGGERRERGEVVVGEIFQR